MENPLECGVAGFGDEAGFINIVKLHAEDPGVDLLAIHGELPRGQKRSAELFKSVTAATDKPVLAFGRSTYSCLDESRAFQEEAGMPFLQAIKPTLRALAGLGLYGERRQLRRAEIACSDRQCGGSRRRESQCAAAAAWHQFAETSDGRYRC